MLAFGGVFRIGRGGEVDRNVVVSSLGHTSIYLWCLGKKQQSWGGSEIVIVTVQEGCA